MSSFCETSSAYLNTYWTLKWIVACTIHLYFMFWTDLTLYFWHNRRQSFDLFFFFVIFSYNLYPIIQKDLIDVNCYLKVARFRNSPVEEKQFSTECSGQAQVNILLNIGLWPITGRKPVTPVRIWPGLLFLLHLRQKKNTKWLLTL